MSHCYQVEPPIPSPSCGTMNSVRDCQELGELVHLFASPYELLRGWVLVLRSVVLDTNVPPAAARLDETPEVQPGASVSDSGWKFV